MAPTASVRLAFLRAVNPLGVIDNPGGTVIRSYPFGQLRLTVGSSKVEGVPLPHDPHDKITTYWGQPVIFMSFDDSPAGRAAFEAARPGDTMQGLNGMLGWNPRELVLSLANTTGPSTRRAYSAAVRKWTVQGIERMQQFIQERTENAAVGDIPQQAQPPEPRTGLIVAVDGEHRTAAARTSLIVAVDGQHRAATGHAGGTPDSTGSGSRVNSYRAGVDELVHLAGRAAATTRVSSTRRQRSDRARELVMLRSEGRCENPRCTSPGFRGVTETGEAILDVDHVHDLQHDGEDFPVNMIALCPNCHALKTRGRGAQELREALAVVARERHTASWER
ncbi:HNH endonuclease [Streptomyces sp. ISL-43]|uniref:HNH endonuclease signature motif containing protein n=1 Tax=Streptomyces sp. ISL-43 TaxID=2819183 RepID=UPI001BE9D2BF|nr:HNH endonuclease signature motif containing protein [Streptomyces sp. ISL-43]MBT2450906.1 HNH endonuclease [Streptomyces sp. ISL-43]